MEHGFINEQRIANVFNNKHVYELDDFHKDMINKMFDNPSEDELIVSKQCDKKYKPDIFIQIGDKKKYISIKTGRSDSMHFEFIETFIKFLRSKGISNTTLKIILLFHYGDGTINGTGKVRYNFDEILIKLADKINKANEELNQSDLINDCLYRFAFKGFNDGEPVVDYIYYGDEKYGTYAKRQHIINFVLSKRYEHIKTLHIGPMNIQPYLRDVNRVSKNIDKREKIQVKWHYLLTDLEYINNMAKWKRWD